MSAPSLRFKEFQGDWIAKTFKEIGYFYYGKSAPKWSLDKDATTPCVRYGELYTKYDGIIEEIYSYTTIPRDTLKFSKGGEVLIPRVGEDPLDFSKASLLTLQNIAIGEMISVFNTEQDGLFLVYYIRAKLTETFAMLVEGGNVSNLYYSFLEDVVIKLPELSEQKKIAQFLSKISLRNSYLEEKLKLLHEYKRGVMQKIFTQEIRFKPKAGNLFPDWGEFAIGNVGQIVTGKTPSTADDSLWNGATPFVTPTDITSSKYQYATGRRVVKTPKMRTIPKGSIMFTCIASIGKMSIATEECITNQQINSIVPYDEFDSEFIYYSLLSIVDYIKSTKSSSTLPIINKTEFSKLILKMPSKDEQSKIAEFLSSVDKKIECLESQIEISKQYKKGLFQQLFI